MFPVGGCGWSGEGEDCGAAGCGRQRLGGDLERDKLKLLDRYQIVSGQSLSKMSGWSSSGHSARSAGSVPPPLAGSASWTRTSGLSISSDERTSRRQFCGAEAGTG